MEPNTIFIIGICLFSLFSIFVSVANYFNKHILHIIFKCFPLTILVIFSIILTPNNYLIYVGFIFALLGDFFILCKFKNSFIVGAISFFISHILFLTQYVLIILSNYSSKPTYFYAFIPLVLVAITITSTLLLFKKIKFLSIPMGMYFSSLIINLLFSVILTVVANEIFILMFVGYLFFIASDIFITLKEYIVELEKHNFIIISTYYLAQALIFSSLMIYLI